MKSIISFLFSFILLTTYSSSSFAQCPNSLEANAKSMICDNTDNRRIYFNTMGGVPPYSYSIDDGTTFSSNSQFDSLSNGLYYLVVQDFAGCISLDTIEISNLPDASMTILYSPPTCDSLFVMSVLPCAGCDFVWDTDTTQQFTHQTTDSGWHRVQVIHPNGNFCIINYDSIYITPAISEANITAPFALCASDTAILIANATNGNAPFTYLWSTGSTTQQIMDSFGVYSVTISDDYGCTATATDTVHLIPNLDSVSMSSALIFFQMGHCINADPTSLMVNLISGSLPNVGFFTGAGVRNGHLGTNGAMFHPDSAVIDMGHTGVTTLTYTYQTTTGCWVETQGTTEVHALPDLSYLNLPPSICPADDSFQIIALNHVVTGPSGSVTYVDTLLQQTGTFVTTDSSGNIIPGFIVLFDTLHPNAALGYDSIYVQYTYTAATSLGGCSATIFDTIPVEDCCVWPGDANDDGVANNYDILPIGLHHGTSGIARSAIAIDWDCKRSTNWGTNITGLTNVDLKHADCDGDGSILPIDTNAIVQNWTLTHSKSSNFSSTGVNIFVDTATHNPGDTVILDVILNASAIPSLGYGVAFTVTYDTVGVKSGSVSIDFSNSWLGTINTDLIGIYKDFYSQGLVEVGMSRIDQVSALGAGPICQIQFIIKDDVLPKSNFIRINFEVSDANFIDSIGGSIATSTILGGVLVMNNYTENSKIQTEKDFNLLAFPNPTTGMLNIDGYQEIIQSIEVNDLTGRSILSKENIGTNKTTINLNAMASGIYFIKVRSESGQEKNLRIVKRP